MALAAGAQNEMKDKLLLISVFLKTLVLILCHIEVLCVFLDGCDELRPAGPSTLPGAGPGWAARSAAALHPHICGSSTQTPATAPFRGLPEIHRGTQC